MKLIRIHLIIIALLFLIIGDSFAVDNSKVGTSAFSFLKIEVFARPTSMGGAFTGVADDASTLYYNPAGLANLEGANFIAAYHNNIFEMQSGFLGYVHPIATGQKAFSYINYLNYGDFIRTDVDGSEHGTFSGSNMVFAAGYAAVLKENFQFGGTAKFIYDKIDQYSSMGAAVDLSAKMILENKLTSFGIMVQNLGAQFSSYTDSSEKKSLPLTFRGGASSRLRGLPLLVAADVVIPTDNDIYFCLGAEFLDLKPLYLRLGWTKFGENYKTGSDNESLAGFSAGFGIEYNKMQISYSISPQAELGTSHRVTFTGGI
jgi:hypothetical protein